MAALLVLIHPTAVPHYTVLQGVRQRTRHLLPHRGAPVHRGPVGGAGPRAGVPAGRHRLQPAGPGGVDVDCRYCGLQKLAILTVSQEGVCEVSWLAPGSAKSPWLEITSDEDNAGLVLVPLPPVQGAWQLLLRLQLQPGAVLQLGLTVRARSAQQGRPAVTVQCGLGTGGWTVVSALQCDPQAETGFQHFLQP